MNLEPHIKQNNHINLNNRMFLQNIELTSKML